MALLAGLAALLGGCREPEPEGPAMAPTGSASERKAPIDYVRPGEVTEGTERAFGFPVPRGMRIRVRFPDAVYAEGRLPFEGLANYVRERVDSARVETGPVKTVFDAAALKSEPEQLLRIEVTSRGGLVELVVRDQARPASPPGLSEADQWRRSGLTPEGKPLPELAE